MEMFDQVTERDRATPGQLVMPFYIVCDVSYSMSRDIQDLNQSLKNLHAAIANEPVVDDVARISVLTFSDTSRIVAPLGQVSETTFPALSVEGGTNYGVAFRKVAEAINADRDALNASGLKIYRPCVFFLTDGMPQDPSWLETFNATLTYDKSTGTGMKGFPIFVPFGFREADEKVLAKLAYPKKGGRWFMAKTISAEDALKSLLEIIMNTVMTSSQSASTGAPGAFQLAPAPAGVASGDSDWDPFVN